MDIAADFDHGDVRPQGEDLLATAGAARGEDGGVAQLGQGAGVLGGRRCGRRAGAGVGIAPEEDVAGVGPLEDSTEFES
ncbi:MAG: hypothetical protein M5U12_18955 [Verrucomicrobia bacterium]|nr:hypothetical protein [Verrucomicrobiota bacterium]